MQITSQDQLSAGMHVFKAYVLGAGSFVDERVIANPNIKEGWATVEMGMRPVQWSLQDAGILPTTFSQHKTFTTREEAEDHIKDAGVQMKHIKQQADVRARVTGFNLFDWE